MGSFRRCLDRPQIAKPFAVLAAAVFCLSPLYSQDEAPYVEPGSLRMTHSLVFDGVLHALRPGYRVTTDELNKLYSVEGSDERPWKAEFGQSLLSEVAARWERGVSARAVLETQGEYADRFWRPININHFDKREDNEVRFREAEGRLDGERGFLHLFSGVDHGSWVDQGDFFGLYPASAGERDYLGSSGFFGVYPDRWRENQYLNISKNPIPRGGVLGTTLFGADVGAAYGDELAWGYRESFYGRVGHPVGPGTLTFVYKDEDVPFSVDESEDERNRAYALSYLWPFEDGGKIQAGVRYNPFRVGDDYLVARDVAGGTGLQGSSHSISRKTSKKEDALAARLRAEHYAALFNRLWFAALDLTREEILAGNRQEAALELATDLTSAVRGHVEVSYRRPIEGPIPFLFEGTPDNIGAVVANPRGPESPFWVNWSNREAAFVTATLWFDPTPDTPMFRYDPKRLDRWNFGPEENAPLTVGFQYRMRDYKTTTDRQYYFDENGSVVWEPAGHSGAWATDHPLHEVRVLTRGRWERTEWMFGVAGGQSPAVLGLAYDQTASESKPLTEYIGFEARFDRFPWGVWGHYGSGVWGPEENIHPNFGFTFDRLWGVGVSYSITRNTTWDVNYLAARQDDDLFTPPDLGSYDEIRTMLVHRFGFLFQFRNPSRPGYQSR